MSVLDLETYRRRAEEFVGALDREYYEHFSGRKPVCDTAAVYDRYPELFTREAVRRARRAVPAHDRATRPSGASPTCSPSPSTASWASRPSTSATRSPTPRAQATIEVDGETIGLRQAGVVQANEADPRRRARIQAGSPRRHRRAAQSAARRASGGAVTSSPASSATPTTWSSTPRSRVIDYGLLRAELEGFLSETEGLYERVMDRLARERLGITLAELTYADLPYLWRAPGYDHVFTAERPGAHAPRDRSPTWASISTPRPTCTSTPRSASSSRRGPSARRCACPTRSTSSSCRRAGRTTTPRCCTRPATPSTSRTRDRDLPFEYRHLGDNAVTEGFAFIFDHLVLNRRWLDALPRVHRRRRLPALRQRQRPVLHAPLRRQAGLRDRAAHADRRPRRHGRRRTATG